MELPDDCPPLRAFRGILFVDVCDSSGWLRTLGDAEGRRVVHEALEVLAEITKAYGGAVIDRIGDEVFCSFPDGPRAARTAAAMQVAIADASELGRLPALLRVRAGLHAGEVLLEGERPQGSAVHLARRVASQAKTEQVLATEAGLAGSRIEARTLDRVRLQGVPEPVELFEVLWSSDATVLVSRGLALPGERDQELVLRVGSATFVLGAERPCATIGRGHRCDLIVEHPAVSRLHARIEHRKRGFVWIDLSTNGTRISPSGGEPCLVRREELPLSGAGAIELGAGAKPDARAPEPLLYEVRRNGGRSSATDG